MGRFFGVVNTDILFLQKKENPRSTELPAWVDVNVLQRNEFTNEKGAIFKISFMLMSLVRGSAHICALFLV